MELEETDVRKKRQRSRLDTGERLERSLKRDIMKRGWLEQKVEKWQRKKFHGRKKQWEKSKKKVKKETCYTSYNLGTSFLLKRSVNLPDFMFSHLCNK